MKTSIEPLIKLLYVFGFLLIITSSCDKENGDTELIDGDGVTDINGYTYKSVIIGSQEWMGENLRVDKFRNGDQISTTDPPTLNIDEETDPIYQWVNENEANYLDNYGRLYTWYAATDERGLCPTGWRLPSDGDWVKLILFLDSDLDPMAIPFLSSIAGGKLKSTRTHPDPHPRWDSPNVNATDMVGFSALPAGHRASNFSSFMFLGSSSAWWSSGDFASGFAVEQNGNAYRHFSYGGNGNPVRCIKD